MQPRVHDGPLVGGLPPTALRLLRMELHNRSQAHIDMERASLLEHATPNNLARFPDSLKTACT